MVKSSIWASVWLVKEADMTKLGWPVALPRFTRRPCDSRMMRAPEGMWIMSTCGLMLVDLEVAQLRHLDLVVEVADVADDGHVLHLLHVIDGDDVLVAGGGDEDVGAAHHVLDGLHREAVHRRLQRADRVDFGHDDAGARALAARRPSPCPRRHSRRPRPPCRPSSRRCRGGWRPPAIRGSRTCCRTSTW